MTTNFKTNTSIGGISFNGTAAVTHDGSIANQVTLPAAKAGTLSVRTDTDTGEITCVAHGLSVGNEIDVYWTTVAGVLEARYGMKVSALDGTTPLDKFTVGTAAGDVGAGDPFPVAPPNHPLTFALRTAIDIDLDFATDAKGFAMECAGRSIVEFFSSVPASLAVIEMAAGQGYFWNQSSGFAAPIAGAVASAKASQALTSAKDLKIGIAYDA